MRQKNVGGSITSTHILIRFGCVFAINNEIKYDDDPNSQWTAPANFMGTRGIFLNFAFE